MDRVFCFGEVLWDCLPDGLFLGGAPLNVAAHLARMGIPSCMISAVGTDVLGDEALLRMERYGVDTRFVARVKDWPTGSVGVRLNEKGEAAYDIRRDVAWDHIPFSEALRESLDGASALVFGTLAMRGVGNVELLGWLMDADWPLRVYDVNFRAPFYNMEEVMALAQFADLVKCNEAEAREICGVATDMIPETLARRLADVMDVGRVCVTLGDKGAVYLGPYGLQHAMAPKVEAVDTVGAGDAFLASVLAGILQGREHQEDFLMGCCRMGALVASKRGAVPDLG